MMLIGRETTLTLLKGSYSLSN